MVDQENPCLRFTRGSKRRSASEAEEERPMKKKRVVLGDLKSLANIVVSLNSKLCQETETSTGKRVLITAKNGDESPAAAIESNSEDPDISPAYVDDIIEYMYQKEAEADKRPSHSYIEKVQKGMSPHMRGVLVDWLVEVAEDYQLITDTLYRTVNYVDRYLSRVSLQTKQLQLLGVSSMLIASKYEEINPPKVQYFSDITDNTYTKEQVSKMEIDILKNLKFELGCPTSITFLRQFLRISSEDYNDSNPQFEFLGQYLAELSLLEYECLKFLPSQIAASVTFLARFIMRPKTHPWTQTLEQYTKYRPVDIKKCVIILHDLYLRRRGHLLRGAVRDKYSTYKFECVANTPVPPMIPESFFDDITW